MPNPRPGALYLVRFTAPEFTSLCPVTGQPDFAHLVIDYAPGETIVESKSLKLFLGSVPQSCGFHEDVTVGIGERLVEEMKPQWLRIGGYWYPRGGMPIDVFWQIGRAARGPVAARPGRALIPRPGLTPASFLVLRYSSAIDAPKATSPSGDRPGELLDQGQRRVIVGRGDDAGEGDVEQAVADDQAGGEQHAHPLGELGIGRRARPSGRRASRSPRRSTTSRVTAIGR